MFSVFFVRRPIVACVISILVIIAGLVAYPALPMAQYPDITPPVIQVTAVYPGASGAVVAQTVAAPIEEEVNGVEGMLYMESTSASDGSYTLKATFEVGTDVNTASVLVQNRVNLALPRLPEEVRRQGVSTDKVSTSMLAILTLSPEEGNRSEIYNDIFLANYMRINVNDEIRRIRGVGDAVTYPTKDYGMRIWLDPERLKSRDMTTQDVINALREQNVQVAAGQIGQPPAPAGQDFQFTISTLGRLEQVEQFEDIIVRATPDGRLVRVKDVARVELGAKNYDTLASVNGVPGAVMLIYQSPGGNAVAVSKELAALVERLRRDLPEGVTLDIRYDTSEFVLSAIDAVYHTLVEAIVLVVAVVLIFLGGVRSTLIPIAAIPVSLIGTFAAMKLFGFSINLPTMFGLILAIGIVVDDAIVVVENVERNMIEHHLSPKDATVKAMGEVFGAVIAISLVLMAVFLPTAAMPGITGQLYRQFAVTIAASTFFSAVCAVTLSPALCAVLLKPHKPGKKPFIFNRLFNAFFDRVSGAYAAVVRLFTRPALIGVTMAMFGATCFAIVWSMKRVPTGFLPVEDRGLLIAEAWLPDGASQERSAAVRDRIAESFRKIDGIETVNALQGYSVLNGIGSNYALVFAVLEDWSVRVPKKRSMETIVADARAAIAPIEEAMTFAFTLPAIDGVGNATGFDLRLQDRVGVGREVMQQLVGEVVADGNAQAKLRNMSSAYRAGVPQLFADIDREKVKKLGIPLQDVFGTLAAYLGSAYINDFNRFGRTWQVTAQAEAKFRSRVEDVRRLEVRSADGKMIPLGTLLRMDEALGPDRVVRYNLYPAASINGEPELGSSSGEALAIIEQMAADKLPPGVGYEWTNLAYQEKKTEGQGGMVFVLALVVVYLILAALYESWLVPFAVVLSIPLGVLGAMLGLMIRGMDNNVYTQIGLVLLVGLGAKNAILIVEFARANRNAGKGILESAVDASRQRLRPIIMTSLAFILGVVPLVKATGAGAASRQAIGTAVFAGMLGNTILGLFFTPALYVVMQWLSEKIGGAPKPKPAPDAPTHAAATPAH